jgi:hypothetical protein
MAKSVRAVSRVASGPTVHEGRLDETGALDPACRVV